MAIAAAAAAAASALQVSHLGPLGIVWSDAKSDLDLFTPHDGRRVHVVVEDGLNLVNSPHLNNGLLSIHVRRVV